MTTINIGLREHLQDALAGRYVLERELGHGGMAAVYLAHDLRHKRPVALKVLQLRIGAEATLGPERFREEIETVARLTHPHILPLLDSGVAEGLPYFTMPYIEGDSLRGRLAREQQLSFADALHVARDVAEALDYAHGRGVVHRDVKPENILLAGRSALVADFGIAWVVRRVADAALGEPLILTDVRLSVGTPAYMSPEQVVGDADLDGRSDIYSLGCVVFEMLSGVPPFGGTTAETLARRLCHPPPSLCTLRTDLPSEIDQVMQRALAVAPGERFPTAAAFVVALAEQTTAAARLAQRPSGRLTSTSSYGRGRRGLARWLLAAAVPVLIHVLQRWAQRGAHGPTGESP